MTQHTILGIVFLFPSGSVDFKHFLLQLLSGPADYLQVWDFVSTCLEVSVSAVYHGLLVWLCCSWRMSCMCSSPWYLLGPVFRLRLVYFGTLFTDAGKEGVFCHWEVDYFTHVDWASTPWWFFSVVSSEMERDLGLTLGFPVSPFRSSRPLLLLSRNPWRPPYFHVNITFFCELVMLLSVFTTGLCSKVSFIQ